MGILDTPAVRAGGSTKRGGQNAAKWRRPTLIIDKVFPNARHDHQIVWVDESAGTAASVTGTAAAGNIGTAGTMFYQLNGTSYSTAFLAGDTPATAVSKINTTLGTAGTASLVGGAVNIVTSTTGSGSTIGINSGTGTVLSDLKLTGLSGTGTGREAYSVGQDRRVRRSTWTNAGSEATAFGVKLSTSPNTSTWAPHGVFMKVPGTGTLLMEQTDTTGGNTTLQRSTNGGVSWTTVWTAPSSTVRFLGPQSLGRDDNTGYLYICEYTVAAADTSVNIWRSTNDGQTWTQWKTMPRGDSGSTNWRHIHSCRYDPVSQRMYFCVGDQNDLAGIYRVNAAGTDVEAVILNNQLQGQFTGTSNGVSAPIIAPARCVDIMFFPNYIVWACDGGGIKDGDYVYRMARSQIGVANPVVTQVAETNSTGWYAVNASTDGSVWIVSTSTEDLGNLNDTGSHLYAITNDGANVDEIGAVQMDNNLNGIASLSGLCDRAGSGNTAFWLRAHQYGEFPGQTISAFQMRCRLVWGSTQIIKPNFVRTDEYLRQGRSQMVSLAAGQTFAFGHTQCPQRTTQLRILNIGVNVTNGTTGTARVSVFNKNSGVELLSWTGGQEWRNNGNADTDAMYQSFVVSPAQIIEFRVVETSGVNPADVTVFVEFGWAF